MSMSDAVHHDALEEERAHRLRKLDLLRERGVEPYPVGLKRDHTAAELHAAYGSLGADARADEAVQVAGRLMLIRRHGGLLFATLHDQTGGIQLLVDRAAAGQEAFAAAEDLDRGDWVWAAGTVVTTHTAELSVDVRELRLLSKTLRPLPDKHRGLSDHEARVRQRYLDLVINRSARRMLRQRSDAVRAVREAGPAEKLVAFEIEGGGIARAGNPVSGGGVVTSGTLSPSLGIGIGMAYVPAERAAVGTELELDVRGKMRRAVVKDKPLYRKGP